jgi:hypothetical protein
VTGGGYDRAAGCSRPERPHCLIAMAIAHVNHLFDLASPRSS